MRLLCQTTQPHHTYYMVLCLAQNFTNHANCVEEVLDMAKKKTKALGVCTMHLVSNHLTIVELFYLSIFKITFNFQGKIKSIVWVRDFSWHGIGTWHVMWWFFKIVVPNKWRILQQSFKTQKITFWGKKNSTTQLP